MLVVDTSAFVSLAVGEVLEPVFDEFAVVSTTVAVEEAGRTAEYDDRHGLAAEVVLDQQSLFEVVDAAGETFVTSRIDEGEASCVAVARDENAAFLITDDFRALPELQQLVEAEVALSPIVLRALVKRGVLAEGEAKTSLETIAERRDWLGQPIYRYARQLFE